MMQAPAKDVLTSTEPEGRKRLLLVSIDESLARFLVNEVGVAKNWHIEWLQDTEAARVAFETRAPELLVEKNSRIHSAPADTRSTWSSPDVIRTH